MLGAQLICQRNLRHFLTKGVELALGGDHEVVVPP